MNKLLKLILLTFLVLFLSWWLVLSPVSFLDKESSYYAYSSDKNWKLFISPLAMTTPLSFIQALEGKRYIVLFDKNGKYIGQSSPFCFMWLDGYDVIFPEGKNDSLLFMPENCDYDIPVNEKKWWSKIIGFIFY